MSVTQEPCLVFAVRVPCDAHCGRVPRLSGVAVVESELVTDRIADIRESSTRIEDQELFVGREEADQCAVDVQRIVIR